MAAFECELARGPLWLSQDGFSFRIVLSRAGHFCRWSARSTSTSRMSGRPLRPEVRCAKRCASLLNARKALNLKLPDGILGILKPTVYHAEARAETARSR